MGLRLTELDLARRQLTAALSTVWPDVTIDDLPEELQERLAWLLTAVQPQQAMRELADWIEARDHGAKAAERRHAGAERLRKLKRGHGVRKAAPRWQRGMRVPRSIEAARSDPRVRGQLATRP